MARINNPVFASVPGTKVTVKAEGSKCVAMFKSFRTTLKDALETESQQGFYVRAKRAAEQLETSYTIGWRADGRNVFGKHTKELSNFRHLLFDTVRRGMAGSISYAELEVIRHQFKIDLARFMTYEFSCTAKQG